MEKINPKSNVIITTGIINEGLSIANTLMKIENSMKKGRMIRNIL